MGSSYSKCCPCVSFEHHGVPAANRIRHGLELHSDCAIGKYNRHRLAVIAAHFDDGDNVTVFAGKGIAGKGDVAGKGEAAAGSFQPIVQRCI